MRSGAGEGVGGSAGVADEVGETDAAEGVAEEGQAGEVGDAGVERGDTGEVADGVLGEALRPAADDRDGGVGERAEDAVEFVPGEGGDVVVGRREETVGDGAAEEGAEEAASGGDAVGKLLIDEGAGQELRVVRRGWGDEEAEAGWK